jgi:hypothetical protein
VIVLVRSVSTVSELLVILGQLSWERHAPDP